MDYRNYVSGLLFGFSIVLIALSVVVLLAGFFLNTPGVFIFQGIVGLILSAFGMKLVEELEETFSYVPGKYVVYGILALVGEFLIMYWFGDSFKYLINGPI